MSETAKDPICGKDVDPLRARAVGIFGGVTYYFCSQDCKARFKDPRKQAREPTRDIATKSKVDSRPPTVESAETEAKNAEPATAAAGPVEAAKPKVRNRDELRARPRDDESTKPRPTSDSIEEDLKAAREPRSGAWMIAVTLLLAAAIALFLYLRK